MEENLQLTVDQKIEKLLHYSRKKTLISGTPPTLLYLFDKENRAYGIKIGKDVLMKNMEMKKILKNIVTSRISELENKNTVKITRIFFTYTANLDVTKEIDLDGTNEDPKYIIYEESPLHINLSIYDCISIQSEGRVYTVLSETPLWAEKIGKLLPKIKIKGTLRNFM